MEGQNDTPFPCMLLSTVVSEDGMAASMIARVTYDIVGDELVVADGQRWRVAVEPWDSPLGAFAPDQPYPKGGCDLFVAGSAKAPNGEPVKELALSLSVGDLRFEAVAIGPRVWQKRVGGGLVPSAPQPFSTLPLGLDRAYGGRSIRVEDEQVHYPLNPGGVGFHLEADRALNQPLPFIEDPNQRISSLDDRPTPVGFGLCQYPNPLRMLDGVTFDGLSPLDYAATSQPGWEKKPPKVALTPRAFNRAFPALIAPRVDPGARVVVQGFSAAGPIAFTVPGAPVVAEVVVGGQTTRHTPQIDELGVDSDNNQVVICFRHAFRYDFVAYEDRRCTLLQDQARTRALRQGKD